MLLLLKNGCMSAEKPQVVNKSWFSLELMECNAKNVRSKSIIWKNIWLIQPQDVLQSIKRTGFWAAIWQKIMMYSICCTCVGKPNSLHILKTIHWMCKIFGALSLNTKMSKTKDGGCIQKNLLIMEFVASKKRGAIMLYFEIFAVHELQKIFWFRSELLRSIYFYSKIVMVFFFIPLYHRL